MSHRMQDERGATAVLVALLSTVLIGTLAFTADFGMAFANKVQTQTAADSAALGAAGVFAQQQFRECADMLSNGLADAQIEATSKVGANDTGTAPGTLDDFDAECVDGDLVVRTTVTAPSPNFFGGLFGRTSDYSLLRSAATVVEAGEVGPKLRPLALCATDLPTATGPGDWFNLYAPGDGLAPPSSCPVPPNPGNWWTLDCPNESASDGHGTAALEAQIRNGCSSPVTVVEGQGTLTGSALNGHLAAECPTKSTAEPFQCLSGDPGQPDAGHVEDAWADLIDAGTTVPIPVFCAPSPGLCATTSITGTGTDAVFPVHRIISVEICGYHFGKQPNRRYVASTPSAGCAAHAAPRAALMSDNSEDVYLMMVAHNLQVSNVTGDSSCDLGDECDRGLRQVRMVDGGFAY